MTTACEVMSGVRVEALVAAMPAVVSFVVPLVTPKRVAGVVVGVVGVVVMPVVAEVVVVVVVEVVEVEVQARICTRRIHGMVSSGYLASAVTTRDARGKTPEERAFACLGCWLDEWFGTSVSSVWPK
jgi:hypothetical protein